jgi:hypothetical protein
VKLRLALALLVTIAASSPALAGVEACEKIKDADAYNACLASYGPAAGAHKVVRAPERADFSRTRRPGAARAQMPTNHEPQVRRMANGRARIEILVPSRH